MGFKAVERFNYFAARDLGLADADLYLAAPHPKWKRVFADEAYLILDELRNESLRLYHCGSTAVPHLDAKPIIDILGSVANLDDLDRQQIRLQEMGYESMGEYGIPGRRFFVLRNPEKTMSYVHLHLFQHGHAAIESHLQIRNYLRHSPEAKAHYLAHKRQWLQDAKLSHDVYNQAKAAALSELQALASKASPPPKILAVVAAAEGHQNTMQFLQESFPQQHLEIINLDATPVVPYSYDKPSCQVFLHIINKVLASDLLILATPVYWYAMSGGMKDFMDRFSNLLNGHHKELGEALYGKRVQLLSTGYEKRLPIGFEIPFAGTAIYFGMDYMGASYLSVKGKKRQPSP